jgi:predicted O-linked N-acetylglucosamine transferase (SPINDLY family)
VSSHKELYPQLLRRPKDEADRREKVRASFNIPADAVVFGGFSQLWKIDPELWATWMTILKETDGSYLFLMRWGPKANEQYLKLHATNVTRCSAQSPLLVTYLESY